MANTTCTATTVWISSTAASAAIRWGAPKRPLAVVLWPRVPAQHLLLPDRRKTSSGESSPEELLAGAHSVSSALTAASHPPLHVQVESICEFGEAVGGDQRIARMSLRVSAIVPGIHPDEFDCIVVAAALFCPISQALRRDVVCCSR
jgi:organic hydroperoxide reductase OsmC/OhrA